MSCTIPDDELADVDFGGVVGLLLIGLATGTNPNLPAGLDRGDLDRSSRLTDGLGRGDLDRTSRLTGNNGDCLRRSRLPVGSSPRPRGCAADWRGVDDLRISRRSSRWVCRLLISR